MLAADMAGWKFPVDRTTAVLMDLFDLEHAVNSSKKPTPYPRPWATAEGGRRFGKTNMSREEVVAVLSRFGHTLGKPSRKRDARGRFTR